MRKYATLDTRATGAITAYLDRCTQFKHIPLAGLDALRSTVVDALVVAEPIALQPTDVMTLIRFVRRGGTLVCTGPVVADWQDHPDLLALIGVSAGPLTPVSEVVVRVAANEHPLMQRFEQSWIVDDRVQLNLLLPADTLSLLQVSWQMQRPSVAYVRSVGAGWIVYSTLGWTPSTLNDPMFADFIARAIQWSDQVDRPDHVNVAMLGFGAIGREHGDAIQAVAGLRLSAVCDRNEQRLTHAIGFYPGIRTYLDQRALADDPAVDLVIVSTPPNTHAAVALELLQAGKHVVVEKPFCLTTAEADNLIDTATRLGRTLTVYQNRRWDADFLAIKQVIQQGRIGDVFHLETFIGGFGHPCDYWHSDATISGGVFYDWGSHYLDWVLDLIPDRVRKVSASTHKRMWHDVTNADQSAIQLRFEGEIEAEFMHSDIAAALKPKWYVLGTKGAIVADWRHETVKTRRWSGDLIEERLQAAESPSIVTLYGRQRGDLIVEERLALPHVPAYAFHRNLANHMLLGTPLAVPATTSRRNIAVMEAATCSALRDGDWVEPC